MNTKRVLDVAGEQANLIEERTGSYRKDLIRCLIEAITAQDEGLSDKGRRDRVTKLVEALGSKVAASAAGS